MSERLATRIQQRLGALEDDGLLRTLRAPSGIDLSSNDYLGLANHPYIKDAMTAAVAREGVGSTGSRLLRGERDSFAALEAHIREVSAPFGALSDAQWTELARSTARQTADGKWRLKYDPGIAVPFRHATPATTDLWAVWDALHCPTLLLRGAESDLLSPETAAAMRARGPKPRFVEFPGVGHAPMLLTPEQIAPVAAFLESR